MPIRDLFPKPCFGERTDFCLSILQDVRPVVPTCLAMLGASDVSRHSNCDSGLKAYGDTLRRLQDDIQAHRWARVWDNLCEAQVAMSCPACKQDEKEEHCVLSLIEEVKMRWSDYRHPVHAALGQAVDDRLRAPGTDARAMPLSRINFTHNTHGERFRHGEHAGETIDWLVRMLADGHIAVDDTSMVIHAVYYHGAYRALNNRHAVALHRLAKTRPGLTCYARMWPLLHGLHLDDGSDADVMDKFWSAMDSEGETIWSRHPGKASSSAATEILRWTAVHVSNISFDAVEADVQRHILAAGYPSCQVMISRRKNGSSNGHARVFFPSREDALRAADSGLPDFWGRSLRVVLDATSTGILDSGGAGGQCDGWLRCKACRARCASLVDVHLLTDHRLPGHSRDASGWDNRREQGFFCISRPDRLLSCKQWPHPERHRFPFKHFIVVCSCQSVLGVVQDATDLGHDFGELVMHFKADKVVLELRECSSKHLEVAKWSALKKALAGGVLTALSTLTVQKVSQMMLTRAQYSSERSDLVRWTDTGSRRKAHEHVCVYYLSGHCRDGDACLKLHVPKDEIPEKLKLFRLTPCKYGEECRNRKTCLFNHD